LGSVAGAVFLLLVAALSGPAQAQATGGGGRGGRLEAVRARAELHVCIWPEYFAISYRNPRTDSFEGLDIDMARVLAGRLGVRLAFVATDFARFMDRLEAGDCDVAMFAVGITPPRRARVAFTRPYLTSRVYAVTMRDSTTVRQWEDIDRPGTVVAVAAGTYMEPLMRETLRHAALLVVRAPATREAELEAGRADVFMSDFPYTRQMALVHDWVRVIEPPGRFGETSYAYAVARGDAAWLALVDNFVAVIKTDGTLARAAERHGLSPIVER
jgi:ABC-type amino acid transport substrate-binding protein